MAKCVITIEDDSEGGVLLAFEFDPPIEDQSLEAKQGSQRIALAISQFIQDTAGDGCKTEVFEE